MTRHDDKHDKSERDHFREIYDTVAENPNKARRDLYAEFMQRRHGKENTSESYARGIAKDFREIRETLKEKGDL